MKLYKALKLKKSIVGEIAKLKLQIAQKNSYPEGSKNGENFDCEAAYNELLKKINYLVGLKFTINEANQELQSKIYVISEYKALIAFWNDVSVTEGTKFDAYSEKSINYKVHFDEAKRNEIVNSFQKKVDALQEEIDLYNFNTEIPWDWSV